MELNPIGWVVAAWAGIALAAIVFGVVMWIVTAVLANTARTMRPRR